MTKRSFGLYVFHYLALSSTAYVLTRYTQITGGWLYIVTAVAAYGGGLALNELLSRIPIVRWCVLGIKKEEKRVSR